MPSYNERLYPWFTVQVPKGYYSYNSKINVFSDYFSADSLPTKHNILLLAHMRIMRLLLYPPLCRLTTSIIHINMFIQHHLQVKSDICEDRMSTNNNFVDTEQRFSCECAKRRALVKSNS